LRHSVHSL